MEEAERKGMGTWNAVYGRVMDPCPGLEKNLTSRLPLGQVAHLAPGRS